MAQAVLEEAAKLFPAYLKEKIFPLGVRVITGNDRANLEKLNINFKKKQWDEGELGLILKLNGFLIIAWTSWLPLQGKFRDNDSLWVLIIQDEKRVYCSPKIVRRSLKFLDRFYWYLRIQIERAKANPKCAECRWFLRIVMPKIEWKKKRKRIGARYRTCTNPMHHKRKRPRVDMDNGMSDESLAFIMPIRKQRERGRVRAIKNNKTYGIGRIQRSQRKQGKPVTKQ